MACSTSIDRPAQGKKKSTSTLINSGRTSPVAYAKLRLILQRPDGLARTNMRDKGQNHRGDEPSEVNKFLVNVREHHEDRRTRPKN
jgi:hypothetical protein